MDVGEALASGESGPDLCDLRKAFEELLEGELGAAVSVAIGGRVVLDLWGGHADAATTRPWTRDTLVNTYSTTKGVTAACILHLVDRGSLELDRPVADYWPEFAAEGKHATTVRHLLSHRAGLAGIRAKIEYADRFDRKLQAAELAAQEPWWEPGSAHGYHAVTFGTLLGELCERVDGRSLGRYWREEIADPLDLDFHIGLHESDFGRCAEVVHQVSQGRASRRARGDSGSSKASANTGSANGFSNALKRDRQNLLGKAFANPAVPHADTNSPEWRRAELPAHGGHGTAASLARFYSILASGGTGTTADGGRHRILSAETIEEATREHSKGRDAVLAPLKTRFGLGFMLASRGIPMGRGERNFGHPGYGGGIAFADPDSGLGFAWIANRMQPQLLGGSQVRGLVDALYDALEEKD